MAKMRCGWSFKQPHVLCLRITELGNVGGNHFEPSFEHKGWKRESNLYGPKLSSNRWVNV